MDQPAHRPIYLPIDDRRLAGCLPSNRLVSRTPGKESLCRTGEEGWLLPILRSRSDCFVASVHLVQENFQFWRLPLWSQSCRDHRKEAKSRIELQLVLRSHTDARNVPFSETWIEDLTNGEERLLSVDSGRRFSKCLDSSRGCCSCSALQSLDWVQLLLEPLPIILRLRSGLFWLFFSRYWSYGEHFDPEMAETEIVFFRGWSGERTCVASEHSRRPATSDQHYRFQGWVVSIWARWVEWVVEMRTRSRSEDFD